MNINLITEFLVALSKRERKTLYKISSLLVGAIFFIAILPMIFIMIGSIFEKHFTLFQNPMVNASVIIISIPLGLAILIWATVTQGAIGEGTPAPSAPTQKLIVVGPFKYCRNPIELGAILYYLGLGTYFGSLTTGLICCFLGLTIGSLYHKLIEEKELELRFGDEYIAYKNSTPFLLPRTQILFRFNIVKCWSFKRK
jgi:protein-S-isoprenylcysteine O-methyltransferase Ste14